jgi:hypothetical protein
MHGGMAPRISGFSAVTKHELKPKSDRETHLVVLAKIWVEEGPQLSCQSQRRYAAVRKSLLAFLPADFIAQ